MNVGKLVLAGDTKQLPAIEAGKPFAQLQQAGLEKSGIDENLRAQTQQMQAINHALDYGDIRQDEIVGACLASLEAGLAERVARA